MINYPDDSAGFLPRLFLSAGPRAWYQAATAASSRCVARMIGF
jgi:hypothetical protein